MTAKKLFFKSLCAGVGFVAIASLMTGCDDSYDLNKMNGTIGLFENGVSAPLGNTKQFYLNDFLNDSNGLLIIDEQGRYAMEYSGKSSTKLDIPAVKIPEVEVKSIVSELNFYNSLPGETKSYLESTGYTPGEILPDMSNHKVDGVHSPIEDTYEPFSIVVEDIPEQVIRINSLIPDDKPIFRLDFHAEGLPKDLDSLRFEFIIHTPVELHLDPLDDDVYLDNQDYYHVEHKLPCIDGKLDDHIEFWVLNYEFESGLECDNEQTITINSDIRFKGAIHLDHACDLSGWDPTLDLTTTYQMGNAYLKKVDGTITANIDPINLTEKLNGMPEILTNPETCLDLEFVSLNVGINNTTPTPITTTLSIISTFYDNTQSAIRIQEPISINANAKETFTFTNEAQYAGMPGYIPNLSDLVYKMPQFMNIKAEPFIPETQLAIYVDTTYNVDVDYALNVPVSVGTEFDLTLNGNFGSLSSALQDVADFVNVVTLKGEINNTLPLDFSLNVTPVDANGKTITGISIVGVPLTIVANDKTPLLLEIKADTPEAMKKVETLTYEISGSTDSANSTLRPTQYLQISDITLHLPQGVVIDVNTL